jgi:hypothetical protein
MHEFLLPTLEERLTGRPPCNEEDKSIPRSLIENSSLLAFDASDLIGDLLLFVFERRGVMGTENSSLLALNASGLIGDLLLIVFERRGVVGTENSSLLAFNESDRIGDLLPFVFERRGDLGMPLVLEDRFMLLLELRLPWSEFGGKISASLEDFLIGTRLCLGDNISSDTCTSSSILLEDFLIGTLLCFETSGDIIIDALDFCECWLDRSNRSLFFFFFTNDCCFFLPDLWLLSSSPVVE